MPKNFAGTDGIRPVMRRNCPVMEIRRESQKVISLTGPSTTLRPTVSDPAKGDVTGRPEGRTFEQGISGIALSSGTRSPAPSPAASTRYLFSGSIPQHWACESWESLPKTAPQPGHATRVVIDHPFRSNLRARRRTGCSAATHHHRGHPAPRRGRTAQFREFAATDPDTKPSRVSDSPIGPTEPVPTPGTMSEIHSYPPPEPNAVRAAGQDAQRFRPAPAAGPRATPRDRIQPFRSLADVTYRL